MAGGPDMLIARDSSPSAYGCARLEQPFTEPLNVIVRKPYPRTLVTVDTEFLIEDASLSGVHWSAPSTPLISLSHINGAGLPTRSGIFRNYQLGTRIQRLEGGVIWPPYVNGASVISTTWKFQDRNWNSPHYATTQLGNDPKHFIYETASFGLTKSGRAFDFNSGQPSASQYDLPAYELKVKTPWGYSYNMKWQESERDNCSGGNMITAFAPKYGYTIDGCPAGQAASVSAGFHWVDHALHASNNGAVLDLRNYAGNVDSYRWSERSQQCGTYAGARYCENVGTNMYVPVLEVQTVQKVR